MTIRGNLGQYYYSSLMHPIYQVAVSVAKQTKMFDHKGLQRLSDR